MIRRINKKKGLLKESEKPGIKFGNFIEDENIL